ncbi:AAA family ATPase [Aureitalea marina]|uniref:AAA family ATPase n=1 Tax=Aureitalea marina TaxID=930804 RepID=A0A2S7KSR4_9FLAO|nr:MoxR family ATPase [Aureitalea marina]PQB05583.1 AAA family ATPase [Aureitalea marina]
MKETHQQIQFLAERMNQSILGQENVVNRIIMVLLANGNLLLEGMPGLAKTRAISSLAKNLDTGLSRIQFTPDLLPSDITGTEVYQPDSDEKFIFQPGPIFNNLILADEINRAPAKVQSALLEAMEERQVTVAGTTHKMDPLFMVMATQNPVEQEGTYPLPEAQMDRFLMHVIVHYPDTESEIKVLDLVRGEASEKQSGGSENETISPQVIFAARDEIAKIKIEESVKRYIVDLVNATRFPAKYSEQLNSWMDYGASPRASIALDKCSRVHAWMNQLDFVTPDNVRAVAHDILRHRIVSSYEANAEGINKDQIIDELLKQVAVA